MITHKTIWPALLTAICLLPNVNGHDIAARHAWQRRQNNGDSNTTDAGPSDLSQAIAQSATVAVIQAHASTSVPAIPIPTSTDQLNDTSNRLENETEFSLENLRKMVAAGPVVPMIDGGEISDEAIGRMIAELRETSSPNDGDVSGAPPSNDPFSAGSGPTRAKRQQSLRVLVVGDSMTNGQQGDCTWRWRIYQWFQAQGISVTFVGPYQGTKPAPIASPPQPPPLYGTEQGQNSLTQKFGGPYCAEAGANSAFANSGHYAAWGRPAALDQYFIQDVVKSHPADLMLVMLGFNDLGWFYSGPGGLIQNMANLVANARQVNPNMKFAIANVPQRSSLGRIDLPPNTDTYNSYLANAVPKWTTNQSPVALVRLRENYQCDQTSCPAGYDGLHPNELGDYQIAQAFSTTLVNTLGIGRSPLSYGNVAISTPPVPANFQVVTSPYGVTATWDPSFGAYGYDTQVSFGYGWVTGSVQANRYDQHFALPNATYQIQVRANRGPNANSAWTSIGSAVAQPQTPNAPTNIQTHSTAGGMTLSWTPPTGVGSDAIVEYNVIVWDTDTPCQWITGGAFKGTSAQLSGLNNGKRYLVWVTAWNQYGEGWPGYGNSVIPGAGAPTTPTGLRIVDKDAASVYYTWDKTPNAAGYYVWLANNYYNSTTAPTGPVRDACGEGYFMFPGVQYWSICIQAYNGNDMSAVGSCQSPPPPNNSSSSQTCSTWVWCPSGTGGAWGPQAEAVQSQPDYGNADGGTPKETQKGGDDAQPTATATTSTGQPGATSVNNGRYNYNVKYYAALGDSFSANPGAGELRNVASDDNKCSRFTQSFPEQLWNAHPFRSDGTLPMTHDFLACSGARASEVPAQIAKFQAAPEVVTLTIGGNDVGFSAVLNSCIYYFYGGWSCDDNKAWSRDQIGSTALANKIDAIIKGVFDKGGQTHIYLEGYPRFFNVDTDYCSTTCFEVFSYSCAEEFLLTKQHRRDINDLVDLLNVQLAAAVNRANPPTGSYISFRDPNPRYEGHRFCEQGVREPDYGNSNIWFYHFTWYKRNWLATFQSSVCDEVSNPHNTAEIGLITACGIWKRQQADPNFVANHLDNNQTFSPASQSDASALSGPGLVPAFITRIFHPTINGAGAFKDDVIAQYNGL